MGEAVFFALITRVAADGSAPMASAPVRSVQGELTLARDDFVAAVEKELRLFSYSRPHHVADFRIACSCAASLPAPSS